MCSDPGACKFGGDYWYRWRLPLFGEKDVNAILREAAECHKSNPDNRVPLIGYDSLKQTQGAPMAVCRGKGY